MAAGECVNVEQAVIREAATVRLRGWDDRIGAVRVHGWARSVGVSC